MGIFIHLDISYSVSEEEWASVFEESLELVKAFPLADLTTVPIRGIDTWCLVRTKEREQKWGWNQENSCVGWFTTGDYETLSTCEEYSLHKNMVSKKTYDPDAPDPLYAYIPRYLENYDKNDPRFSSYFSIWHNKTQGRSYHLYLLAIACMICSRLGAKAHVYGDITYDQCREAVELANEYLENKIDMPDTCYPDRLLNRLQSLPVSDMEKSELFSHLYIGKQDEWFGELASAFNRKTKVLQDRRDKYDISEFEDLPYFEADDTISPPIIQKAADYFTFYKSLLENDTFKMLMTRSAEDRCRWLAKRNENIVIRDADWEKIYDDICTTPESFERYFPMMCVGITSESVNALIRAIVLNDDFYQYIYHLEKKAEKEGNE